MEQPTPHRTISIRLKRQDGPGKPPYHETFHVPYKPNMNVISALQAIAANPVTAEGKATTPPVWDAACLEEVCGSCTMVINGRVRQSCSTLIDELIAGREVIEIEPMSKFPVIRDLIVDRQRMFDELIRIKGWIPIDGTHDLGPGPKETPESQAERYAYSRCMTCGCCLEACPQFQLNNRFIGAQIIAQSLHFNEHETGSRLRGDRLDELMNPGGITDCGNARNCVKVCPKDIPLTEAIAKIGRHTTRRAISRFFSDK